MISIDPVQLPESLQRAWNQIARDIREKFRLCLHEGGHAMQIRRHGGDVRYLGPYVKYDGQRALGAVSPIGKVQFEPIEQAAIFIAGPLLVHQITGTLDDHEKLEESNDVKRLAATLNTTDEKLQLAKEMGEFAVLADMSEPDFLIRLEADVRGYEREIFGTNETWDWAMKEYCLDWFRERIPVGNNSLGYLMWLVLDGEKVRLFLHGQERQPNERIFGCTLEVYPLNPGKRAADAVCRWNEMVSDSQSEQNHG